MESRSILLEIQSWKDFREKLRPLSNKAKGDCFESLVQHFLKLDPKYRTQLQHIWSCAKVPAKIRQCLKLPGQDEGIDLVAKTKEGRFWAIQCKYREDDSKSITRRELSTFTDLAFSICEGFDLALVCTTADRRSRKLRLYGDRVTFCSGDVWRSLGEEFFQLLHSSLKGKPVSLTPRMPRPHQERALKNGFTHFSKKGQQRGKLIMPCGAGKSLVGYWLAKKLDASAILIAVPSLALIRQTLQDWTRECVATGEEQRWIVVCSDPTVKDFKDEDSPVLVQDLGVRVHTDIKEISMWLSEQTEKKTVVFTTYQSGPNVCEAARAAGLKFDLAVLDEAHKTVGRKDALFSYLLHNENIHVRKRIFMTATERRYLGQSEQIASMEDPELYGETFELLTFKEALEAHPPILSDYEIITIVVSHEEVSDLIRGNLFVRPNKGRWDSEIEAQMLASVIALRKAMDRRPIRHVVSFHNSIARAETFKINQDIFGNAFPEFGQMETFHVSGSMPTAVRSHHLELFANAERSLVTNARCLTEGIDLPDIDCVLFADPKKSAIDIVQAVGRALRTSPQKSKGYVIVPALIETHPPGNEDSQEAVYQSVLTVLRALAANDERIIDYFRATSQGRRPSAGILPFSIEFPDGMVIDADDFIKSVELRFWSRLAKLSWRPFVEARQYVRNLRLKNNLEWREFCLGWLPITVTRPEDIPTNPDKVYKETGWLSWGDWLGTGTVSVHKRNYRPFLQAREFVHGLGLRGKADWDHLSQAGRLPPDIPMAPDLKYRNKGWISWGDWLGTGYVAHRFREYRSFTEARRFVHTLALRNTDEWRKYCKGELPEKGQKPDDIPGDPGVVYRKKGWKNLGDWLGTNVIAPRLRKYRDFQQAREFVRSLGLKNRREWNEFCGKGSLPDDIPRAPHHVYKTAGWVNMGDWLGTFTIAPHERRWRSFHEARDFARKLKLKSNSEWRKYAKGDLPSKGKRPQDIPSTPDRIYKGQGWLSWGDWLGTGRKATRSIRYRSFDEARRFARSLNLTGYNEWRAYCRGRIPEKEARPVDIPANPYRTYRDQGWISWPDWLGTA